MKRRIFKTTLLILILITSFGQNIIQGSELSNADNVTIVAIESKDNIVSETTDFIYNELKDVYYTSIIEVDKKSDLNEIRNTMGIILVVGHGTEEGIKLRDKYISLDRIEKFTKNNDGSKFTMFVSCDSGSYAQSVDQFGYEGIVDAKLAAVQAISIVHSLNDNQQGVEDITSYVADNLIEFGIRATHPDKVGNTLALSLSPSGTNLDIDFDYSGFDIVFDIDLDINAGITIRTGCAQYAWGVCVLPYAYPDPYFNGIDFNIGDGISANFDLDHTTVSYSNGGSTTINNGDLSDFSTVLEGGDPEELYYKLMVYVSEVINTEYFETLQAIDNASFSYNENQRQTELDPITPNIIPNRPNTPSGPNSVNVGQSSSWSFYSTDSDSSTIWYQIDWGDGNVETYEAQPGVTTSFSHTYSSSGTKQVKARASSGSGYSSWSNSKSVTVNPDQKPTPSKPSGPTSATLYRSSTWQFKATDPDSSIITLQISWGDGTTSTVSANSGYWKSVSHTYYSSGYKYITVRAKSAYSGWSSYSSSLRVSVGSGSPSPYPTPLPLPFSSSDPAQLDSSQENQTTSFTGMNESSIEDNNELKLNGVSGSSGISLDACAVVCTVPILTGVSAVLLAKIILVVALIFAIGYFIYLMFTTNIFLDFVTWLVDGFSSLWTYITGIGTYVYGAMKKFIDDLINIGGTGVVYRPGNDIWVDWETIISELIRLKNKGVEWGKYLFMTALAALELTAYTMKWAQTNSYSNPGARSEARNDPWHTKFDKDGNDKPRRYEIKITMADLGESMFKFAVKELANKLADIGSKLPWVDTPPSNAGHEGNKQGDLGEILAGAWAEAYSNIKVVEKLPVPGATRQSDWLVTAINNNIFDFEVKSINSEGIIVDRDKLDNKINYKFKEASNKQSQYIDPRATHTLIGVYFLGVVYSSFAGIIPDPRSMELENTLFIGWYQHP